MICAFLMIGTVYGPYRFYHHEVTQQAASFMFATQRIAWAVGNWVYLQKLVYKL